jgi:hypothetical protein
MSSPRRTKHLVLIGAALLALTALPVVAQDTTDCAKGFVCVDYGNSVVEIDPSQGFLQSVVVQERTLTIKDFDGTKTEQQVMVATFVSDGDSYRLDREDIEPQIGIFKDAQLGDVYVQTKAK